MKNNIYAILDKARQNNEARTVTIKGVKNLSNSDLDAIELYAQTIDQTGSYDGLMTPRGEVAEVLRKFDYVIDHDCFTR